MAKAESEAKNVFLPRAAKGEDQNFYVFINGVSYIIPRGKNVEVPDFVAAEINRSIEAENKFWETSESLKAKD